MLLFSAPSFDYGLRIVEVGAPHYSGRVIHPLGGEVPTAVFDSTRESCYASCAVLCGRRSLRDKEWSIEDSGGSNDVE